MIVFRNNTRGNRASIANCRLNCASNLLMERFLRNVCRFSITGYADDGIEVMEVVEEEEVEDDDDIDGVFYTKEDECRYG
jgi:hypothetical protein